MRLLPHHTRTELSPAQTPVSQELEERKKWLAHDVELEALALGGVWQLAGREGLGLEHARLWRHRQQEVMQLRNHLSHIRAEKRISVSNTAVREAKPQLS